MEILEVGKLKLKFNLNENLKEFKDTIYSMLTFVSFNEFDHRISSFVEYGKGYIVFFIHNDSKSFDFNFIFNIKFFDELQYITIYNHVSQKEKVYELEKYKNLHKDFIELVSHQ